MKKITLLLLLLSSCTILFAQAPQKMSHQSVIRKTDGTLVANTLVNIKTSILSGSASGAASYVETQTTTTNNNGLATIEIGGGTPVTGTFAGISWGDGSHFIKTEIDPTGGSNYTISGTSQLLSVPYALYAGNSKSNQGKTSIVITGDITDAQAAEQITAEFGPNTENIYVNGTTNLTTLDLGVVKKVINLRIIDNLKLTNVSLNNLIEVYSDLNIGNNAKLSSISFPVLKTIYGFDSSISGNSSLQSITMPSLTKAQGIFFRKNPFLSSIELPVLATVYGEEASLNFDNNALPSFQVNLILSRILIISPTSGKYIQLQGQNPPAPPTGEGIVSKITLESRGNNVRTD